MNTVRWFRQRRGLTPGMAVGLYLALGVAWVFLGDWLLTALVHDADRLARWELWKGWAYVALTAVLAGWLVRRLRTAERTRWLREREFSQVVRHASAGIARVALDGQVLWSNARLLEMLGLDERALKGLDFRQLVPPDEPAWASKQLGRLLVRRFAPPSLPWGTAWACRCWPKASRRRSSSLFCKKWVATIFRAICAAGPYQPTHLKPCCARSRASRLDFRTRSHA